VKFTSEDIIRGFIGVMTNWSLCSAAAKSVSSNCCLIASTFSSTARFVSVNSLLRCSNAFLFSANFRWSKEDFAFEVFAWLTSSIASSVIFFAVNSALCAASLDDEAPSLLRRENLALDLILDNLRAYSCRYKNEKSIYISGTIYIFISGTI